MANTKNQQPYFPHYANTRNEDKLIHLRMQLGVAGYGVYFMLLERLRMADDFRCGLDFDVLSWDFNCETELIESVIFDFGLFDIVCDGTMFQSVELSSYMEFMEEKKRKRAEAARMAANARWGNKTESNENESDPDNESEDAPNIEHQKFCLEKEIELMAEEAEWLKNIAKVAKRSVKDINVLLESYRDECLCHGREEGHSSYKDAKEHFFSWVLKYHKGTTSSDVVAHTGTTRNSSQRESQYQEFRERQRVEREQKHLQMIKQSTSTADYIRNKGYDPAVVDMVKLMQPGWVENNPPTHPEWIGQFVKKENPELQEAI